VIIDPLKYKHNFFKVDAIHAKERPVKSLTWAGVEPVSDEDALPKWNAGEEKETEIDRYGKPESTTLSAEKEQRASQRQIAKDGSEWFSDPTEQIERITRRMEYDDDEDDFFDKLDKKSTSTASMGSARQSTDLNPQNLEDEEDLSAERSKSMSILRNLLGMAEPTEESRAQHFGVQWVQPKRFDPTDIVSIEALLREEEESINDANDGGDKADVDMEAPEDDADSDAENEAIADADVGLEEAPAQRQQAPTEKLESIPNQPPPPTSSSSSSTTLPTYSVSSNLRNLVFDSNAESEGSHKISGLFGSLAADDSTELLGTGTGPGLRGDEIRAAAGAAGGGVIGKTESFSLVAALGLEPETSAEVCIYFTRQK
jgi:hypothetical protein